MENEKFDIVIVGSGLGGLACGSILSKNGYKVCVLEKHFQIGGCLQDFVRKGCTFDTGMHYIGSYDEGQILRQLFKYFGLEGKLNTQRLDPQGFDVFQIAGKEYRYSMGMDNFKKDLIAQFPEEAVAINKYVDTINDVVAKIDLYNLRDTAVTYAQTVEAMGVNAFDFIQSLTANPELQQVLSALNSLYGGTKSMTSLYMHAIINKFFIDSAYRLVGGGGQIAQGLKETIEAYGGSVRTNAEIIRFVVENKKVTSVCLKSGEHVAAESFISNIHPAVTVKLVDEGAFRKAFVHRIEAMENTISCFSMYIVFKPQAFKHRNSNYYFNQTGSVWCADDYSAEKWPQGYMLYTAESTEYPGYAESAVVITPMKYEEMSAWEDTSIEKRGDEYKAMKKLKAEKLIALISQAFTQFDQTIASCYTATPLTYRDYTGTKAGSMYGVVRDFSNPLHSVILPRTSIQNLLFTGQNINLHGVLGVSMGAILTASEFIPINELIKSIKNA